MRLELCHADTCLPDYWPGHNRPHIAIPVRRGMTMREIEYMLRHELRHGCIMGSSDDARLLSADMVAPDEVRRADALTRAAYAAINRLSPAKKGQRKFFTDLADYEDGVEECYAFFVFMPLE